MTDRVTDAWRAAHPLPAIGAGLDKDERGCVLVVGGSALVPGAVMLTGEAVLRTGAGKVQIGTVGAAATAIGVAFPESAVIGLPSDDEGEIADDAVPPLRRHLGRCDTLILGPGMTHRPHTATLLAGLIESLCATATVVLDAGVIAAVGACRTNCIVTPHHGELASLLEVEKEEIGRDPAGSAARAAKAFGAIVVLKSAETVIADPAGSLLHYSSAAPGLGTAGSGDVLAGIIGGLLARGAEPWTAAGWGVWLHGAAGCAAAERSGAIGYLARDLLAQIPRLLPAD